MARFSPDTETGTQPEEETYTYTGPLAESLADDYSAPDAAVKTVIQPVPASEAPATGFAPSPGESDASSEESDKEDLLEEEPVFEENPDYDYGALSRNILEKILEGRSFGLDDGNATWTYGSTDYVSVDVGDEEYVVLYGLSGFLRFGNGACPTADDMRELRSNKCAIFDDVLLDSDAAAGTTEIGVTLWLPRFPSDPSNVADRFPAIVILPLDDGEEFVGELEANQYCDSMGELKWYVDASGLSPSLPAGWSGTVEAGGETGFRVNGRQDITTSSEHIDVAGDGSVLGDDTSITIDGSQFMVDAADGVAPGATRIAIDPPSENVRVEDGEPVLRDMRDPSTANPVVRVSGADLDPMRTGNYYIVEPTDDFFRVRITDENGEKVEAFQLIVYFDDEGTVTSGYGDTFKGFRKILLGPSRNVFGVDFDGIRLFGAGASGYYWSAYFVDVTYFVRRRDDVGLFQLDVHGESGEPSDNQVIAWDGTNKRYHWKDDEVGTATSGLAVVSTDSTLTGDGTASDPLEVANPFTPAEKTKLGGIPAGAEANVGVEFTQTEKTKLAGIAAGATVGQRIFTAYNASDTYVSGDEVVLTRAQYDAIATKTAGVKYFIRS